MTDAPCGRVSIIMPAYNCADVIGFAINSVRRQTYTDWELIIVDDCSTDRTSELLSDLLQAGDPRIHVLRNDVNSGPARSRNKAIRHATGRWIAFLDSDDLWLPQKLERQVAFMHERHIAFSYTDYEHIDQAGRRMFERVYGPRVISQSLFHKYCWVGCLTVMYDANVVGLVQGTPLKNREDYALWLKIVKKTPCYRLPETLSLYRTGQSGSQSAGGFARLLKYHYRLFRISEEESPIKALMSTIQNMIFGFFKKTYYVRSIRK
ncbi:MAG: glycosyltransferase [Actinomycetaceae bacterium]|nr:glycosyltransferase [Actinomycetaceae bacterium]MDY5855163.1 glycosyltransferase [Arcanobacterium sp.]